VDPIIYSKAAGGIVQMIFSYGLAAVCGILIVMLIALFIHMSRKNERLTSEFGEMLEKNQSQILSFGNKCVRAIERFNGSTKKRDKDIKEINKTLDEIKDGMKE